MTYGATNQSALLALLLRPLPLLPDGANTVRSFSIFDTSLSCQTVVGAAHPPGRPSVTCSSSESNIIPVFFLSRCTCWPSTAMIWRGGSVRAPDRLIRRSVTSLGAGWEKRGEERRGEEKGRQGKGQDERRRRKCKAKEGVDDAAALASRGVTCRQLFHKLCRSPRSRALASPSVVRRRLDAEARNRQMSIRSCHPPF